MDNTDLAHPWLATLWSDPVEAVRLLWSGRVWRGAQAKAPLSEFLLDVVPDDPEWKSKLCEGLLNWLDERRGDDAGRRREHGINAYLLDLREAFTSVYLLNLQDCADALRARQTVYDRWLTPLTTSSARDARLEYWRVLAICPSDAALLPRWVQWVRESGDSSVFRLPARYGSVALRALRALPNGEDDRFNLRAILFALVWRAMDQYPQATRRSEAIDELSMTWKEIRALYPRTEAFWASLEGEVLRSIVASNDQRNWLDSAVVTRARHAPVGTPQKGAPQARKQLAPPPLDDVFRVGKAIRTEPLELSFEKLRTLLERQSAYANATGDSYFLIRTLSNLGTQWLRHDALPTSALQSLERMALEGIDWEPANTYIWSLWATCLLRLRRFDVAEAVLWDMRRRFPENAHCRVNLAGLLMYGAEKRYSDAEALLREVISRQPDNETAQVELARLLMFGPAKRYVEAEALLRNAVAEHAEDEPSRVELARLLIRLTSDYSEGLALLESLPRRTPLAEDVLARLAAGVSATNHFEEWWQRSESEFANIPSKYQPSTEGRHGSLSDEASYRGPLDWDVARLERAAFRLNAAIRMGTDGTSSSDVAEAWSLISEARSADPGIAALAETHSLWLAASGGSAAVDADLERDYPGSYGVQASAVWWKSSDDDAKAWKDLESKFFTRRGETLALRVLQAIYRRAEPSKPAVAAFEKWHAALPKLHEEEAHREPQLAFQHFIAQQVNQLRVRSDDDGGVEIRLLGDALTTCSM